MPEQFGTAACSRHTRSLERGQTTAAGPARLAAGLASLQRRAALRRSSNSTQGLFTGSKSSRRGLGDGGWGGGGGIGSEASRGARSGCLGARTGMPRAARTAGGAASASFCSSRGAGCSPSFCRALSQRLARSKSKQSSSCSALRMRPAPLHWARAERRERARRVGAWDKSRREAS